MDVLLTSAYSPGRPLRALLHSSTVDRFGVHRTIDDASRADIILFLESHHYEDPNYTVLRRHQLVTDYPDKVFTYNESDTPFYTLPGLYCSMPRRAFRPTAQRAFSYLAPLNEFLPGEAQMTEGDLLYSFIGAANHRVRRRVYELDDPRGFVEDTTAFNIWHEPSPDELRRRKEHYAEVMVRSTFVLCPRGAGTSSYRLFETMQIGRVPVVIADQWVPPRGPDWNTFIVQVAESDIARVPEILASRAEEAGERGRLARAAWEQYFSPEVLFHRAVEACADLTHRRTSIERRFPCLPSIEEARVRAYLYAKTTKRRLKSLARRR